MKGYSFRSLTDLVLKIFKTKVNAGTGLSGGGSLEADRTLSVDYGTTAGTAAQGNDSRLSDSREWKEATIPQAEAEDGVATTRRAFTAQRVRQAIVAWYNGISGVLGRTILTRTSADQVRSDIGLGTAALKDVGTDVGQVISNSSDSLMGAVVSASSSLGTSGFWEITLPYKADSTRMFAFQIREFSSYNLSTIDVSGYLYAYTDNWSRPTCTISGVNPPSVRFGKNAEGYAVIVVSFGQYSGIGIYNATSGLGSSVNLHGTTITRHDTLPNHTYVESTTILANTSDNIRQTLGTSTDFPMSQKAITDALMSQKATTDALGQPLMTGSTTLNGSTNNTIQLTNIVSTLGLEVGDVIRLQYSGYNKLHTVDSISNNNLIVVNYEHAGNRVNGRLKLGNRTVTVTITRIAKWYNAPIGLGQEWLNVTSHREINTSYYMTANRACSVSVLSQWIGDGAIVSLIVNNLLVGWSSSTRPYATAGSSSAIVPLEGNYRVESTIRPRIILELR